MLLWNQPHSNRCRFCQILYFQGELLCLRILVLYSRPRTKEHVEEYSFNHFLNYLVLNVWLTFSNNFILISNVEFYYTLSGYIIVFTIQSGLLSTINYSYPLLLCSTLPPYFDHHIFVFVHEFFSA